MSTTTSSVSGLTRDPLVERARALLGQIAPALGHLSADQLVAHARHAAHRLVADARTAATDATETAERLVAERLTARIKAQVAPPLKAAITIALVALVVALIALYRTRGRP